MLVVEGMDGSGKTTLIETLKKELGWPIAPRVVSKDTNPLVELDEWVDENIEAGWQRTIFDRHRLISEPIYAPIIGREPMGKMKDRFWLGIAQADFRAIEPVVVFCIPPFDVVEQNLAEATDQPTIIMERSFELYWLYYHRACQYEDCFIYDYTSAVAEDQIKHILHEARQRAMERTPDK